MPRSLASRFFIASLLILPVLLVIFALSLEAAFRSSLLSGEEERLKTQSYLILGEAFFFSEQLIVENIQDERYNQFNSGLYGIIYDELGEELWRSPSAELLELPDNKPITIVQGETNFTTLENNSDPLFVYYYDVVFVLEDDSEKKMRFTVLHHQAQAIAEQQAYRNKLWQYLILIGLIIIISQMAILRWGLQPLNRLAKDLVLVESGKAQALGGEYPSEIQAVTDNLNQVLASERQQRQRYRNTLDDLAHSLKTPLSVIKGSVGIDKHDSTISDQVERMNQIISHQLRRAVVSSPGVPGNTVEIKPIVERLIASLNKVYRDKNIVATIEDFTPVVFSGDERDLMEVLGNLIENAFKYGKHKLCISACESDKDIEIMIEDDGEGVIEENRQTILQRGARADTATAGQGIGLAVAVDILSSYNGSLQVTESKLGGAQFTVTLLKDSD